MDTPAARFRKKFDAWFAEFKKTPYAIPTAMAISVGVFYLTVAYLSAWFCLAGLVPPLGMLLAFWGFGIKDVKRLLIYGVITSLLFVGVGVAYATNYYTGAEPRVASSTDNVLSDGIVTPQRGNTSTVYNYSVTVHLDLAAANASIWDVSVTIWGPGRGAAEYLMTQTEQLDNMTFVYSYETTLSKAVNMFIFAANITSAEYANGYEMVVATDHEGDEALPLIGPVHSSSMRVAGEITPLMAYTSFVVFFPIYAIIVFMVWWTRRARTIREKRVADWERARREEEEAPKEDVKVPSLAKAMGLEPDTFVCSECGADVPADAKACPKCGEKFE